MIQQRKKDYLQRLIEDFFAKFEAIGRDGNDGDREEKKVVLNSCFQFFFDNFGLKRDDSSTKVLSKIESYELSEQYASLLMKEYELLTTENRNKEELEKALSIVIYLDKTDSTYSWERTILREDILRLLNEEAAAQNND